MANNIFSPELRKDYLTPEITTIKAEGNKILLVSVKTIPVLTEDNDPFEWQ